MFVLREELYEVVMYVLLQAQSKGTKKIKPNYRVRIWFLLNHLLYTASGKLYFYRKPSVYANS